MILPITENWRIKSDPYQWIVQRKQIRKRRGKQVTEWASCTYHGSLEAAIRRLAEQQLRESPAEGWEEAIQAVHRVIAQLNEALPSHVCVDVSPTPAVPSDQCPAESVEREGPELGKPAATKLAGPRSADISG